MMLLKTFLLFCLAIGYTTAETRVKRQSYPPNQAPYRQSQGYQQPQGYQQQQQQPYAQQQPQQYAQQQAQRPPRQQYGGGGAPQEEEKEQGPHPLTLLLENSKFECGSKSDGYYADSGVGCQAFHYCVSGQKHSMMCPAGTVFHQVHLNCVPQDQDICNKADKFYFVNDYLNKAVENGPNNTVVYANRYYPENYANGDPFIPPSEANKQQQPPAATYGLGPAYREQQPAHAQQAYRPPSNHIQQAPAQHAGYQQAAAHRPQNPAPYSPQVPPQAYQQRPAHQPAVAVQAPARPAQPQSQLYGYGAQQAYNAQQQQAQRAYAQQQYQALAPQQQLYGAGAGQRQRFAQQY